MKEVEVKAHLKDEKKVLEKLKALGCTLSEPVNQVDTVYTKITGTLDDYLANDHFVRIREMADGRSILTVKKPLSREVLTKSEHETEILNAAELKQALFLMGYKIANKVSKVRRTARFKEFEVCVDEVDELGAFIEVEKMSDDDKADSAREELNDFMTSLGVPIEDEVRKGYDIMAIEATL